jgi:hypothetical protein
MKKEIQLRLSAIMVAAFIMTVSNADAAPGYTIFGPAEIDLSSCSPNGPTGNVVVPIWIMRDAAITGPTQVRFNNLPADVKVSFATQLNFTGIIAELLMATFTVNAGVDFPDQVIEIRVSDPSHVVVNKIMLHGTCPRENKDFTIRGSFFSSNLGVVLPVDGALVEIYRDVGWGGADQHVGSVKTAKDGSFEAHLWANDEDTYYAKLLLNDVEGVYLHDWWNPSIKDYNSANRGSNSNPVIDVGGTLITVDGGSGTPRVSVWQGARAAYQEFVKTNGTAPPVGDYEIVIQNTPGLDAWTARSTTNWPEEYKTRNTEGLPILAETDFGFDPYFSLFLNNYGTNFHEFGHALRHTVDGDQRHLTDDASRWTYLRKHTLCGSAHGYVDIEAFAFNEGWAEYWEITTPEIVEANCSSINFSDMTVEGAVAADLFKLSHALDNCLVFPNKNPADSERIRRKAMFSVVNRGQNIMHSEGEFRSNFAQQFPGCTLPPIGSIGVSMMPLSTLIRHNSYDPKKMLTIFQERIHHFDVYIKETQTEIARAKEQSKKMSARNGLQCDTCLEKLLRPTLLNGRLKYMQFLSQAFKKRYAIINQKKVGSGTQEKIEKETERGLLATVKQRKELNRAMLKECISSLQKYFSNNKSAYANDRLAYFVRRLKLLDLNTPVNEEGNMLGDLPAWLTGEAVGRMERGKKGNY